MWTNAALLFPCVTTMPIVRILKELITVPVKLDLLETGKPAMVREYQNTKVTTTSAAALLRLIFPYFVIY